MKYSIGFIGTGKMGHAIATRAYSLFGKSCKGMYAYDKDKSKTDLLRKQTDMEIMESEIQVIEKSDIIVVALLPDVIRKELSDMTDFFEGKIIISTAAGVSIETMKKIFGEGAKIFRTMPNRPALIGKGITIVSFMEEDVSEGDVDGVMELLSSIGKTQILPESLMNEVIALTGSSPAYVFMLIEAMASGAVLRGLPSDLAYKLAAMAVEGSAAMVTDTGQHPAVLRDEICTPGGTTIEAVRALEEAGFKSAVIEAMERCTQRAIDIGKKV